MWAIFHNVTLLDLVDTESEASEYIGAIESGGSFSYVYVADLLGLKERLNAQCATY